MNVYTGNQAKTLLESGNMPVNSIGVCKCSQGWAYWYWDGSIFDSGVKKSEELALRTAKSNIT